jgi:WD40 repeat protein
MMRWDRGGILALLILAAVRLPSSDPTPVPLVGASRKHGGSEADQPWVSPARHHAMPALLRRSALPGIGPLRHGLSVGHLFLRILRGGGQSRHVKKRKEAKKEALRHESEMARRWKEHDQVKEKPPATTAAPSSQPPVPPRGARERAVSTQGAVDGEQSPMGEMDGAQAAPDGDATGPYKRLDGRSLGRYRYRGNTTGPSLEPMADGSEDAAEVQSMDDSAVLADSDVVFLDSDEVCVGPDGEPLDGSGDDSDPGALTTIAHSAGNMAEEGGGEGGEQGDWSLRTERDDSKFCILHSAPVFAVVLSPFDEGVFATGGGDDKVQLLSVAEEGQRGADRDKVALRYLENATFGDSVVGLSFSHDGTYLAAAGMDGYVRVWLADSGSLVAVLEGSGALIWVEWHPRGPVLVAGSDDGCTYLWEISHGFSPAGGQTYEGTCLHVFAGHAEAVTCGGFAAGGRLVVTATCAGILRVYSPKTGSLLFCIEDHTNFHAGAITTLACHPVDAVVVSGDQGGRVCVVQVQTGKCKLTLPAHPATGHTASVESIAISRQLRGMVLTGSLDGTARVWDLSSGAERCRSALSLTPGAAEGITKVLWAAHMPMFVAGGVAGSIMVCSGIDGQRLRTFSAHSHVLPAPSPAPPHNTLPDPHLVHELTGAD